MSHSPAPDKSSQPRSLIAVPPAYDLPRESVALSKNRVQAPVTSQALNAGLASI
jgi:hypothetical protein